MISYAIRTYAWHTYRAYVEIQALQISILGGRVFFKGLHYHGQNETILLNDGYITWRYWLRRVRDIEFARQEASNEGPGSSEGCEETRGGGEHQQGEQKVLGNLPCRVVLKSRGLQWFIYNRTPAYDNVLKSMSSGGVENRTSDGAYGKQETTFNMDSSVPTKSRRSPATSIDVEADSVKKSIDDIGEKESGSISTESLDNLPASKSPEAASRLPSVLTILPIKIECIRGAFVLGNQNTRSVLVARFESVAGYIDTRSSCTVDQYKQCIDMDFQHPVIELKPNKDYKESQLATGAKVKSDENHRLMARERWLLFKICGQRLHKAWTSLREPTLYNKSSVESLSQEYSKQRPKTPTQAPGVPGQHRWLGLTRYLDDDNNSVEQERWKAIEYGEVSTIVDSPKIAMSVHWDVPGTVPRFHDRTYSTMPEFATDINGDAPPDWGIELRVSGGTVSYGPWADRQRTDLQNIFFPTLYKDGVPALRLKPGQRRISTVFKFVVEIEEEISLLLPIREESKDWKWKPCTKSGNGPDTKKKGKIGHVRKKKGHKGVAAPDVRPFGWLDVKLLPNSTVRLTMDLVAGSNGYKSRVDMDLRGPEMSSSVNHGLLWRSMTQIISCDLSYPLGWNALRQWQINVESDGLELFLLRDHIYLLTDLVSDWTSGPPGDFHMFVPFEYGINLRFTNFKLYLNANDSNIIDNPSDVDENTFVVVWGKTLSAQLNIPLKQFRPLHNRIYFDVKVSNGGFELRTPPWNTQHTFVNNVNVAALDDLMIHGSYNYFTSTSPNLTDVVLVNVHGLSPEIHLYGFLVRYFMKIKDNYFGEDLHFRTLEEYQGQVAQKELEPESVVSNPPSRLSNDLDVILSITAENASALLPAHLYSTAENLRLDISSIIGDLRFTNYYMDLAVTFSPVAVSLGASVEPLSSQSVEDSSTQIFIDGFEISGHRLFGLPPTEPTYVCNWDFNVGSVTGECSVDFLRLLLLALRCFALSFGDGENALPPLHPPLINDVTFLSVSLRPVSVWIRFEQKALLFSTSEIRFDYNDWATSHFSERFRVVLPNISVSMVDTGKHSGDRRSTHLLATTYAYLETAVLLRMVKRQLEPRANRLLQQNHISIHDSRTRRTKWLMQDVNGLNPTSIPSRQTRVRPPAMPFPPMPEPISNDNGASADSASVSTSSTQTTTSRKSSFLAKVSRRQTSARRRVNALTLKYQGSNTNATGSTPLPAISASCLLGTDQPQFPSSNDPTRHHSRNCRLNHSSCMHHSKAKCSSAFSSPYKGPNLSLRHVDANLGDVPILPDNLPDDHIINDASVFERIEPQISAQDHEQSSFIINFNRGLRAYCTSEALTQSSLLMEMLQPRDTVSLLDMLQIEAMADVVASGKKRSSQQKVIEARIFMPCLHARIVNNPTFTHHGSIPQEQADMIVHKFTATSRSTKDTSVQKGNTTDQHLVHVIVGQIKLDVKGHTGDFSDDRAAMQATINDPTIWISYGTRLFADLQFQDMDISSAGRTVDHVASLAHQTAALAEGSLRRFSKATTERSKQTQMLLLSLTIAWDNIPDPPFLTRASYVLRSATSHLRISDSWKMLSRLRYVHQSLPDRSKAQIVQQWTQGPRVSLEAARDRVTTRFEQWRTWDVAHIKKSLLMLKVFGNISNPNHKRLRSQFLGEASIRAGGIRLRIEPGPNQNQVMVDRLAINIASNARNNTLDGTSQGNVSTALNLVVQTHCARSEVLLSWNVCKLLESTLRYFQAPLSATPEQAHHDSSEEAIEKGRNLHFTAFVDTAVIGFSSLNLRATTVFGGLKQSLVFMNMPEHPQGSTASLLVNADNASSEVHSHSRCMTHLEISMPSIFYSKNGRFEDRNGNCKLATSCKELSLKVLEHPLRLLEITDLVLQDEVTYIRGLAQSLNPINNQNHSPDLSSQPVFLERFHLALLLHSYSVNFTILPSLTYMVAGQGIHSSVKAGTRQRSKILIDFDIQTHTHIFTRHDSPSFDKISTLHMPPTNGRLTLDLGSPQKSVILHGRVEDIALDASAVHALLATVNRPEVNGLAMNIHRELDLVRNHCRELFPSDPPSSDAQGPIWYSAHVTWAGVIIDTNTLGSDAGLREAQLRFSLGCLQLKATNRDSDNGQAIIFPEFELKLRGMDVHLTKPDDNGLHPCGDVGIVAMLKFTSEEGENGKLIRAYHVRSTNLAINLYAETVPAVTEIITLLQDRLKSIDLPNEVKSLRKQRLASFSSEVLTSKPGDTGNDVVSSFLSSAMYSLEMADIHICWKMRVSKPISPGREIEDLVLSFTKINLATKRDNAAQLLMQDFQLQMVPCSRSRSFGRTLNSALLPEVVFKVAYLSNTKDRRLAFQAAGKSLDIRLTPQFILPAAALRRSIAVAFDDFRAATRRPQNNPLTQRESQTQKIFRHKKLASVLVDADFAGAVVYVQGQNVSDSVPSELNNVHGGRPTQHGRYGQFTHEDASSSITLRAPGIALKIEYKDAGVDEPSLNAEFKVDASSNILYPTVVPLVIDILSSVKEVVGESESQGKALEPKLSPPKFLGEESLRTADPSAILGKCRLNLGLRICRQEFSLSCQPIARVAATAHFDDIYVTVNTVQSTDYGQFFTLSAAFTRLQVSIQHVYSRESTASFDVESVVLSLMNSRHVSVAKGISAILKISPMKALINAKQMQDFLLFREIWIPPEIRHSPKPSVPIPSSGPQAFIIERYQQVAAAGAFPWNATVSIAELDVQLDLGQSLGKSKFVVSNFWVSSKKTSVWEQNLCLGFEKVEMNGKGRMSGFITLQNFRIRTSIGWPIIQQTLKQTPLIQASLGFDHLRMKAAFDFQAFLVGHITSLNFLMYNVRDTHQARGDRLVGTVDGDKVQIFCITTSASQGLALYQTVQRLIQEKQAAYETSLRDIEKYMRRKPSIRPAVTQGEAKQEQIHISTHTPWQLQTDVVVTLKTVNVGAFPSTFFDNQIFKLEALDASARFAVRLDHGRIHSNLGMTLGQVRIALSNITRSSLPKTLGEVSVEDVVACATGSRGGTILKVPRLVATMHTWQNPESTHIDYIFKSSFQGKVDVGWNYSRIGFLRGMLTSHTRALAQRLGKPLPQSALQITGGPQPEGEGDGGRQRLEDGGQEKITAVVNVPQSKYEYTALQPAIIETPQLRDMGEATPPLEWIGLHRDRLPNLTHQIVIVTLLEVAKEVEDAYSKIIGSA